MAKGPLGHTAEDLLGRRIRQEREQRGWSQSELAERLTEYGVDLHFTAIAKIEQRGVDRPRVIRFNEAIAFARVFGLKVEELLDPGDPILSTFRKLESAAVKAKLGVHTSLSQLLYLRNVSDSLYNFSPGYYVKHLEEAASALGAMIDEARGVIQERLDQYVSPLEPSAVAGEPED